MICFSVVTKMLISEELGPCEVPNAPHIPFVDTYLWEKVSPP